jgi:GT2 family glycosyltransferase
MRISVVTVSYNSAQFITDYLDSLITNLTPLDEVIIVDSGSEDDTTEVIEKFSQKKKNIKLIKSKENIGFGKGCNMGVSEALGEYILFLNPDTKVLEGGVDKLYQFISVHPEGGIVAPQLIQDGGVIQPSIRKLPTILGAIKEYYLGIKNSYEAYFLDGDSFYQVESVVGAAMMMKRELFIKIGGFDEKYFMYFEDLDLCRKTLKAGKNIYYLPAAKFFHKVGGTVTYKERNLAWLKDAAKLYHGYFYYLILDLVLRLRPKR